MDKEPRKPLEERSRYPHTDEPEAGKPPSGAAPNPERPKRTQVDPAAQGPIEETTPAEQEEGQEGVGPGPRDIARTEEKPSHPPAEGDA